MKKHKREKTHRVDAIGQRGYVFPARLPGKLPSLPGVEDIAHQNRNRRPRQNAPEDVTIRQMDQLAAETDDENKLDQIVDHETEETVQIFADKPWWIK